MNELKVITHPEFGKIRTEMVKNEPWFVGKDVCRSFGDNQHKRTLSNLDEDEKGVAHIDTPGGKQYVTVINESGFYHLLFMYQPQKGTNKEIADERVAFLRKFRKWVTGEVLPSIRRTGKYMPETAQTTRRLAADELPDLLMTVNTMLRYGDKVRVARDLGVNVQNVYKVLLGQMRSAKILDALYECALENRRNPKDIYGNAGSALEKLING